MRKLTLIAGRFRYLRAGSLEPLPAGILISLIIATAGAWALTLYHALGTSRSMGSAVEDMAMHSMPAAGWSFGSLIAFLAIWTLMMVAMMLPSAMPMMLIFASAQARRSSHVAVPTWTLLAGYVLIWGTSGLIFYAVAEVGTIYVSHFPALAPLGLGAALVMAGLYQFTPLKKVCLRHCRSPFAFVAQHWREGRVGALLMGARHGLYCLGCCWVLFTVLMAAGMMSVGWMLLLTLVVFAEKLFPHGARISHVVGVLFVVCGLLYAIDGVSLFQFK